MKPRLGRPTDVDAITNVMISTMPLDPQWDYRFAHRHEYPEDHYKYTRMIVECFLDPSYDDWLVMVVEDSPKPGAPREVVSFGVWNVSYINKRLHGPKYTAQSPGNAVDKRGGKTRRDADHARLAQFRKSQHQAYRDFFAALDPEQLHLQILATLPLFQRRGHATSLCAWAMERVRRDALNDMSVMASPMGHRLYTRLRFEEAGTFYVQVPGEEERLVLRAMVYKPARLPEAVVVEKVPRLEGGSRCVLV